MATLGMDVSGILLTWPIDLHLLWFTSNEMGSIPVRLWSSTLDILFGQKMCRILLRHLFWNTSSMWHPRLVTFQDSAAYSSTLSTLLLKMRIFVFLPIIFVFQMFFRAANAPLALLILVLISASVFPSFVILAPRYVNSVTSSVLFSGSAVWLLFRIVLVLSLLTWSPTFAAFLTSFSVLLCMSLWLCASKDMSSAKSRSPSESVKLYIKYLMCTEVFQPRKIIQGSPKKKDNYFTVWTVLLYSSLYKN